MTEEVSWTPWHPNDFLHTKSDVLSSDPYDPVPPPSVSSPVLFGDLPKDPPTSNWASKDSKVTGLGRFVVTDDKILLRLRSWLDWWWPVYHPFLIHIYTSFILSFTPRLFVNFTVLITIPPIDPYRPVPHPGCSLWHTLYQHSFVPLSLTTKYLNFHLGWKVRHYTRWPPGFSRLSNSKNISELQGLSIHIGTIHLSRGSWL